MEHDLITRKKTDLVAVLDDKGIGEMLKPLIQEIYLFDTHIAGTSYLTERAVLDEIQPGDVLTLVREDNKYDEHAILVFSADHKKLGYIPEKDNLVFSRLLDAGKKLTARITKIDEPDGVFVRISIRIFMVDF